MSFLYLLSAVFMLLFLITVHELGHFYAARWCKIPVKEFAVGFGWKFFQWKGKKHDTVYVLRCIPFGGYCMFYGEDEVDDQKRKDPRSIGNFSVLKRLIVTFMGPLVNLLLALVLCFGFFSIAGIPTVSGVEMSISSVVEASPAAQAGLQEGDQPIKVNGEDANAMQADGVINLFKHIEAYKVGDAPLELIVLRNGEEVTLHATPTENNEEKRMMIGATFTQQFQNEMVRTNIINSFTYSFNFCVEQGKMIADALFNLFKGIGFDNMAGPVGIVNMISTQTQQAGFVAYLSMIILISVNLGILNLVPFPGLDGSRILLLLVEAVRKKPLNQKIEAYIHLAGFAAFILLFIALTYQDILRLF